MLAHGVYCLLVVGLVVSESNGTPTELRNSLLSRLFNNHYYSLNSPRTNWAYNNGDIAQKYQSSSQQRYMHEDTLRNYDSHWHAGVKTVPYQVGTSGHTNFFPSSQHWSPSYYTTWSSANHTNFKNGYNKSNTVISGNAYGSFNQDAIEGSHSMYQYQQTRPTTTERVVKKFPLYQLKTQPHYKGTENSGKPKYRHSAFYYLPTSYKHTVYPKVHKPFDKYKYPAKKTVHPFYRKYYQSPYQQYSVTSSDLGFVRHKMQDGTQEHGYYKVSEPTTATTQRTTGGSRYYTTERMDIYPATSEEYTSFNGTYHKLNDKYYETYEELENTTQEPEETSYEETTTRGYYGDRIYMGTQMPLKTYDKTLPKNKYFVVRRTSDNDDI